MEKEYVDLQGVSGDVKPWKKHQKIDKLYISSWKNTKTVESKLKDGPV